MSEKRGDHDMWPAIFWVFVAIVIALGRIQWRMGKDLRDDANREKDFCTALLKTMDSQADSAVITRTWFCERPKP